MQFVTLIFFFALVGGAAFLSAHWGANDWYRDLRKPGFTPPNWVFPIVWPILYALMAFSGWLIWESDHPYRAAALALWTAQLALNALWPLLVLRPEEHHSRHGRYRGAVDHHCGLYRSRGANQPARCASLLSVSHLD